jgi:uncharacterized protein YecE (DUF72 family)
MGEYRVGTSGWRYTGWRGDFYPHDLVQRRELEFLSSRMNSVEINGSFYSLQRASSYQRWAAETPNDFVFAVKGGRYITHMKKLRDVRAPLANFFASGLLALGAKLGPVLWQLPEALTFKPDVLQDFLELLPKTQAAAAELGAEHDEKVREPWLQVATNRPLRHALEPRHPSFADEACYELLRAHDVALVSADTAGRWPLFEEQTASFSYARLHGATQLYASNYDDAALQSWRTRLRQWTVEGEEDAYVYFDNDINGYAPHNAIRLMQLLKQQGE